MAMAMALENIKSLVVSQDTDDICIKRDDLEEGEIDDDISNDGVSIGKPDEHDRNIRPFAIINHHNAISVPVPSVEVHDEETLTSHPPQIKSNYTTSTPRELPSCSIRDSRYLDRLTQGDITSSTSECDEKTSVTHVGKVKKYMVFPKTRKRKRHKHVEGIESILMSKKLKRNDVKIVSEKTERDVSHSSKNEAVNDDELLFVRGASPIICSDYNYLSHYERKISDRANRSLLDNSHYQLHIDESSTSTGSCDSPPPIIRSHYKKSHKVEDTELSEKKRRLKKKRHHNDPGNNSKRCTNRKMKLCKYYLAGSCSKKETCIYMHSKFPCKFYHTGRRCFAGDHCKFSHKAHNKNPQSLLDTHEKTASKEIKGGHNNISTSIGKKKIPSLLEIEVPIPPQLLKHNIMFRENLRSPNKYGLPVSEEGGSRTPMPSSPKYDSQNQYGIFAVIHPEDMNDLRDSNKEIPQLEDMKVKNVENREIELEMKNNKQITCSPAQPIIALQECYGRGQSENNNFLPLNLPKKQRELFLRIQQQQKKATTSNILIHQKGSELKRMNDTEEKKIIEEDWYSSDEEDASLINVLKNLCSQTSSLNSSKEFSHKEISESVSRNFSSIKLQTKNITSDLKGSSASTSQLAEHIDALVQEPTMLARDPRLASRDFHSKNNITASAIVPSSYCCTQTERRPSKNSTTNCYNSLGNISIYNNTAAASSSESSEEIQISGGFSGRETINFGGGGDVGFRKMVSSQDFQNRKKHDVDLRQMVTPLTSSFSLICNDADIRGPGPSGDIDLREIMGLPFNPVPNHKPATEVDASLHSHPPIPYKLVPIAIPRPNFSGLKVNKADPHVLNDPRLRKLFNLSSNNVNNKVPLPSVWSTHHSVLPVTTNNRIIEQ